jgi:hypothetical protein
MQNTFIGSLLLLGGIWVSLGSNKTKGTILLITLLLIVSISLVISLKTAPDVTEHLDGGAETVKGSTGAGKGNAETGKGSSGVGKEIQLVKQLPMPLEISQPVASGEKVEKLARTIDQPPNPPFIKVSGKASKTVNNVKLTDANNNILQSGINNDGTEFNYQCPDGTNIVGYDLNTEGSGQQNTSIFGGFGPVYCADGTVIGNSVGKPKSGTIGQKPQTNLSKFDFVDNKVLAFDNSMMGTVNDSSLEQCAFVCDYLKENCGGFTHSETDKKCGLAYIVDSNKLQQNSKGRTYMKVQQNKAS